VARNWEGSVIGSEYDDDVSLSINGIAPYQPYDGSGELKLVREIYCDFAC
jgi:hypothetical protein